LYFSASIIKVIKSRTMGWMGRVVRRGGKGNAHEILLGKI